MTRKVTIQAQWAKKSDLKRTLLMIGDADFSIAMVYDFINGGWGADCYLNAHKDFSNRFRTKEEAQAWVESQLGARPVEEKA